MAKRTEEDKPEPDPSLTRTSRDFLVQAELCLHIPFPSEPNPSYEFEFVSKLSHASPAQTVWLEIDQDPYTLLLTSSLYLPAVQKSTTPL